MNEINFNQNKPESKNQRYTDLKGLCVFTTLSKDPARALAIRAGAKIKIGKRSIYDLDLVQQELDRMRVLQSGKGNSVE